MKDANRQSLEALLSPQVLNMGMIRLVFYYAVYFTAKPYVKYKDILHYLTP